MHVFRQLEGTGKIELWRRQDINGSDGTQLILPGTQRFESTFLSGPIELRQSSGRESFKEPIGGPVTEGSYAPAIGFIPLYIGGAPAIDKGYGQCTSAAAGLPAASAATAAPRKSQSNTTTSAGQSRKSGGELPSAFWQRLDHCPVPQPNCGT